MEEGVKGYIKHQLVGSTYILGEGKDKDMLILVENAVAARSWFIQQGWVCESDTSSKYDNAKFYSLRKDKNNALLVADEDYYNRFITAAEVCKYLKLESREARVAVHGIVRDGHLTERYT